MSRYPRDTFVRHVHPTEILEALARGDVPCDLAPESHHQHHVWLFETDERAWREGVERERAARAVV